MLSPQKRDYGTCAKLKRRQLSQNVGQLGLAETCSNAYLVEVPRAHFFGVTSPQHVLLVFIASSVDSRLFTFCVGSFVSFLLKRWYWPPSHANSEVSVLDSCCCPYLFTNSADSLVRVTSRVVCELCENKRT